MRLIANWWLSIDYVTFIIMLTLMAVGLLLITAASPAMSERIGTPSFYFIHKQIQFMLIALPCMIIPTLMGEKALRTLSFISLFIIILLLCLLPFFGDVTKGAKRWISVAGFSLQPSEFLKPFYGVVIAKILTTSKSKNFINFASEIDKMNKNGNERFFIASILHMLIIGLLLMQPDFGMTVTVSVVTGIQFFLAGLPIHFIIIMLTILCIGFWGAYIALPHVTKRIDLFMHGSNEHCYQVHKSLESYARGGFWGTGPGEGALKYMLPDSHTDFIFATAGEELGIVFCLIVLALLAFLVLRCITQIANLKSQYDICVAISSITYIAFQSLFNIGVTLHLFPTKGMTLPFISYGGSSLIALSLAMGIYLQITRKSRLRTRSKSDLIIFGPKISAIYH